MSKLEISELECMLVQWGRWMQDKSDITRLDYKRSDAIQHLRGGGLSLPRISDQAAMVIHSAMKDLERCHRETWQCVDLYYRYRLSCVGVADKLGMDRKEVSKKVEAGKFWIWRQLSLEGIAA